MTTENINATADFDWTTEAMTLWLINLAEDDIADKIKDSFPDFSQTITVDNQMVSCITPSVTASGSVNFLPTFAPRTATGGTKTTGFGSLGGLTTIKTVGSNTRGTTKPITTKILAR